MSRIRNILIALFALAALLPSVAEASGTTTKPGLFVNLTTDDTWAAAKAIMFAHQKALKNGHEPVAIWLNVRGIYLADKKRPSHVHGLMRENNQSIQDMLAAFIKDGGKVIMCQACSKAAGLTKADYIDGVEMGSWDIMEPLLFDENMKTLSW